jgi:hypothetical protein
VTVAAIRGVRLALALTDHLQRGGRARCLTPEQSADLRAADQYARDEARQHPTLSRWRPRFDKI